MLGRAQESVAAEKLLSFVADIYERFLHLLRLLFGDLGETLALGADDLSIAITDQFLVLLLRRDH